MELKNTFINRSGGIPIEVVYRDVENDSEISGKKISAVHAYCFYGDKMVIVYAANRNSWTPPGGGVEDCESAEEAVIREVLEESNMKVLKQKFIGYQDIYEPQGIVTQTRSICIVEPYGDFVSDPDDGEITEIKLIDPKDYKQYFDWGEIGDHIIKRAVEIKEKMV